MSLSDLLSIGRSALLAHQRALTITAQNVANAQTPGYSRQILNLRAGAVYRAGVGWIGQGVNEGGVYRVRDQFLDAMYRRRAGLYAGAQELSNQLQQVESALSEPSDDGISSSLDAFFHSFSDLANEPVSATNRRLVLAAAGRLMAQLRDASGTLDEVAEQAVARLRGQVEELNEITRGIAELNERILAAGSGGVAPELEDQRDLLLDRLAELVPVQARVQEDGTVDVTSNGRMLVQGDRAESLAVAQVDGGGWGLTIASDGSAFTADSGSIGSLVTLLNGTLPDLRAQLDEFAAAFVREVNQIHREGTTQSGRTGVDFFDPNGLTAGTIALSADVADSIAEIATGTSADPGDNTIALRIADLAYQRLDSLGGTTLRDRYLQVASSVAGATRSAMDEATVQEALAVQADVARQAVSGVSIDEEMVNLVSQQEAYAAAARLIQVSMELMDAILRI